MTFIVCARVPREDMSRTDEAMRDPIIDDEFLHYIIQRADYRNTGPLKVIKALADDNRIKIVTLLESGRMSVAQISDAVGLSPSLTSHNMKILRDADIVTASRSGKETLYGLTRKYHTKVLLEMCDSFKSKEEEP